MLIKDVTLVILGWLLGLLAPVIVSAIQDKREIAKLKTAIYTELKEFHQRLVLIIYKIESKHGHLNKEFLSWIQSSLTKYNNTSIDDSLLKTLDSLLQLTDNQISVINAKQQKSLGSGLSLKKLHLPLLDSNIASLSKLDSSMRRQLLEVRAHLGFMNEIADDARDYFKLSFQQGISEKNYEIADNNMINEYKSYKAQAETTIKIIDKILTKSHVDLKT